MRGKSSRVENQSRLRRRRSWKIVQEDSRALSARRWNMKLGLRREKRTPSTLLSGCTLRRGPSPEIKAEFISDFRITFIHLSSHERAHLDTRTSLFSLSLPFFFFRHFNSICEFSASSPRKFAPANLITDSFSQALSTIHHVRDRRIIISPVPEQITLTYSRYVRKFPFSVRAELIAP